jgi:hypothetical protein
VLCFRSVFEGSAQGEGGRAAVMPGGGNRQNVPRASGFMEWVLPYGAPSAAQWIAMMAQRHFYEFGTTSEQLGQIAVNARKNAMLNPKAIYTDPMTLDDYLSSRHHHHALALCTTATSRATAHRDDRVARRHDPDLRKPPIRIEAVGTALRGRPSWDQWDDLTTMAMRDAARSCGRAPT